MKAIPAQEYLGWCPISTDLTSLEESGLAWHTSGPYISGQVVDCSRFLEEWKSTGNGEVQGLGGAVVVGPIGPRLKTPALELQVACCETFERLPRLLQNASGCRPMGQLRRPCPACFSSSSQPVMRARTKERQQTTEPRLCTRQSHDCTAHADYSIFSAPGSNQNSNQSNPPNRAQRGKPETGETGPSFDAKQLRTQGTPVEPRRVAHNRTTTSTPDINRRPARDTRRGCHVVFSLH
jgi:hypothetical protein